MNIYILPYKMASESAKALSAYFNARRIRPDNTSRWRPREDKVVINWGSSKVDLNHMKDANIVNPMDKVNIAADKLKAFQILKEDGKVPIPDFTTDMEEAKKWIDEGDMVVCRTVLRGHSGDGIVLASTHDELVKAPLYTRYFKKKTEYRFHVVGGHVVDVARKARKLEVDDEAVNWQVRNLKGGFIYARENVQAPDMFYQYAVDTIKALGLDFGAVDIIHNVKKNAAVVLEVNCAPGLAGVTINNYGRYLSRYISRKFNKRQVPEPIYDENGKVNWRAVERRAREVGGPMDAPVRRRD